MSNLAARPLRVSISTVAPPQITTTIGLVPGLCSSRYSVIFPGNGVVLTGGFTGISRKSEEVMKLERFTYVHLILIIAAFDIDNSCWLPLNFRTLI